MPVGPADGFPPTKGGTVVPPSNFQFVTTCNPVHIMLSDKFPSCTRTHAPAPPRVLNVLIACEESQAECQAFRALGHRAFSCDIQPCRPGANPDWHIQDDVTPLLQGQIHFVSQSGISCTVDRWDLIIAHPPCTYLCKVGSPWMVVRGQV